jgi:hypothetical protein
MLQWESSRSRHVVCSTKLLGVVSRRQSYRQWQWWAYLYRRRTRRDLPQTILKICFTAT